MKNLFSYHEVYLYEKRFLSVKSYHPNFNLTILMQNTNLLYFRRHRINQIGLISSFVICIINRADCISHLNLVWNMRFIVNVMSD